MSVQRTQSPLLFTLMADEGFEPSEVVIASDKPDIIILLLFHNHNIMSVFYRVLKCVVFASLHVSGSHDGRGLFGVLYDC